MKTLEEYNNILKSNLPYKCKLDDVFFFGKHKNKTMQTVLTEELTYLKWCVLNINWFEMSDELKKKYNERVSKRGHFIYQDDYTRFIISAVYPEIVFTTKDWFEESVNVKKRLYFFLDKKSSIFDEYDRQKIAKVYDSYRKNKNYDHFEYLRKKRERNNNLNILQEQVLVDFADFSQDYIKNIFSIDHDDYF